MSGLEDPLGEPGCLEEQAALNAAIDPSNFENLEREVPQDLEDFGAGEKADNAVDYGDLELSDEGEKGNIDELFDDSLDVQGTPGNRDSLEKAAANDLNLPDIIDPQARKEQLLQQKLFDEHRKRTGLPSHAAHTMLETPRSNEELIAALWPKFHRNTTPRFIDLLPPKRARYAHREPLKPPRSLHPAKISLDVDEDGERRFKASLNGRKRSWTEMESSGLIHVKLGDTLERESDDETHRDSDCSSQDTHGVSRQDLQMLCDDWNLSADSDTDIDLGGNIMRHRSRQHGRSMADLYREGRRVMDGKSPNYPKQSLASTPSFIRHPENATAHIAKKVKIDLNDPSLLVLQATSPNVISPLKHPFLHQDRPASVRDHHQRYNISNDEAYDLLKESHQHRIRGMLGIFHVEHGMPALRLQWPFFKTRLDKHEMRSFHRPAFKVNKHEQISFSKPGFLKKKHVKGKEPQVLFPESNDLSLGDNSNALLLEYSEEYPMMLSNMSMGSKIINHYRKRAVDDNTRPKLDIGELNTLLPADKSPLTTLSRLEHGETISAVHNTMYGAPIFRHNVKETDFLIVRNTTGVRGSSWYLRNIDHLQVVGQEFPSVDVPGPHSRKVTTAAKNRLRMISYRLVRKNKSHRISVSRVTRHFPSSSDMQNRQKMKEFMQFDKDHKEWKMRAGEAIPDEEHVRAMIKPEDVCLLESMQVGQQHLLDAGLGKDDDDASEDEESKEGGSVEHRLAPWFTSRNFLNASGDKAMIEVHGEGDPSGRGEALSFIKVSMKGGFQAIGKSSVDHMKDKDMKAQGRNFNFDRQRDAYDEAIKRIWYAQKASLAATIEHSDPEEDQDDVSEISDAVPVDPPSYARGPVSARRRDDDSVSQSTRWSTNSQSGKVLEITRTVRDRYGTEEVVKDIVRNPRVIRQYLRRRRALEVASVDVLDIKPGEDDAENKWKEQTLKKELARLERNKDRRIARDKQKGLTMDGAAEGEGSPTSPHANAAKSGVTMRKCANCGMVGHIKTNKKLCPMLNGTRKPEEGFSTTAFTSGAPVL